jgi:beta-fructofuranosidase
VNRRRFLLNSLVSSGGWSARGTAFGAFAKTWAVLPSGLSPSLPEKLMHDPLRPQFHLLPAANWMNDPCAPRFFRGEYHMFFQYNPGAAVWGDMHWAHAKSPDLIHWTHLPLALSPSSGSYDAFGCFTGSVLPDADAPTILYTGVTRTTPDQETIRGEGLREVQCIAVATDPGLLNWKRAARPVLDRPPNGLKVTGFRDPCPWKDGDIWYLGIGSGFPKVGGAVLLYRSSDGRNWEYLHALAQGQWNGGTQINPVDTGEMWECPDFFPLGSKYVLLYSAERRVYWEVGEFDKHELKFRAETKGLLDHGFYYAMKSMIDAKGRRILWGWVEEDRPAQECLAAGWAGAMALPRVLTLEGNQLRMEVIPEFASLLRNTRRLPAFAITELGAAFAKMPIVNRTCNLVVEFQTKGGTYGLELRGRSDSNEAALLAINSGSQSGKPSVSIGDHTIALSPNPEGISTIDLWMDGSVIEIFIDRREAITVRSYKRVANDIRIAWTGAGAALKSLIHSDVTPISPDRLTR